MARTDLYKDSFNNIKKYVDDLFHKIQKGTGDMLKSVYDKNNNGKVDISESVSLNQKPQSVTETEIKFGVDADGKWGYIKGGADTVTPFKGDPNLQSKTATASTSVQTITADSGYDGLSEVEINAITGEKDLGTFLMNATFANLNVAGYATAKVTIAVPQAELQSNKTVSPTKSQQVVTPDSGYDGLEQVTVNGIPSQGMFQYAFPDRTMPTAITSNGRYSYSAQTAYDTQTEGYYEGYSLSSGGITIDVNVPTATLQSKTQNIEFSQSSWSAQYTAYTTISPDTGYDGMSQLQVREEFLRDTQLISATGVVTPSTYYNGNTVVSNSAKMLNVRPSKKGHAETSNDWVVAANSYFGNATAADVASGKTFSSSAGIQVTGTGSIPSGTYSYGSITSNGSKNINVASYEYISFTVSVPQPSGTYSYGSITTNGSKTINVKDYEYISFTVNVPSGGSIQTSKSTFPKYNSSVNVTPDSGYDGMAKVVVGSVKNGMTLLWNNSSPSSTFAGQTISLNSTSALYHNWTDYAAILIYYRPHKDNTSTYYYAVLLEYGTINAHNSTSTAKFALCGRASTSASATSGSMYERPFRFDTTSTITFGGGTQAGGTSTSNNVMIPVAVYGIL